MSLAFLRVSLSCRVRSHFSKIQIQFVRNSSTKTEHQTMPLFIQAEKFLSNTAVVDQHGSHRYKQLVQRANRLTEKIGKVCGENTAGGNVAILCPHDVSYVVSQWSCWIAGSAVVPLSPSHPESQLEYFLSDSEAKLVIYTEDYAEKVEAACRDLNVKRLQINPQDFLHAETTETHTEEPVTLSRKFQNELTNDDFRTKNALIIYTSGTTGRPKGVVHTFGSLHASVAGMVREWAWTERDVILHVLPLHHVHGIVNCLMTPLSVGATCLMLPKFHAHTVWQYLLQPPHTPFRISVFMAVPTIYVMMLREYHTMVAQGEWSPETVRRLCSEIRLMVSGSAALPVPILKQWQEISGHVLLERYGMTETLMVLTNPYTGNRTPGAVGHPFPGTEVCIVKPADQPDQSDTVIVTSNSEGTEVVPDEDGVGKLYVKGTSLFKEYYNRPEATEETFTMLGSDRWFETGDTARYEDGAYRILGRTSVDIIKHGGYKISALEIERVFLEHAAVDDIAVVGLPDETYGEIIGAVIATSSLSSLSGEPLSSSSSSSSSHSSLSSSSSSHSSSTEKEKEERTEPVLETLRAWGAQRMPAYWLPQKLRVVPHIPKNIMGKVNKKELRKEMFPEY